MTCLLSSPVISNVNPCDSCYIIVSRKLGPSVHVKQAYHICRCCFSKWLWSPCAICM